jgi:peptidoglycan/LPS O-acetylase OafA/YrhL
MGCLLAYVFRMQKVHLTVPLFLLLAGCLGAGAFVYLKILHHQLGREGLNYIFIIGGAMLLLWTCATLDRNRKLAGFKLYPLLVVGDASYSIYLTHTLLIKVLFDMAAQIIKVHTLQITTVQANLLFCSIALVTTGIGILVHFTIEKPLLNYTNSKFVPDRKAAR